MDDGRAAVDDDGSSSGGGGPLLLLLRSVGSGGGGSGGGTNKKFLQSEAQKSADILHRVMNGSLSKEKERDVKKGKYARGETAYDYDYDDGLGAGSFKKKKVSAHTSSCLLDN